MKKTTIEKIKLVFGIAVCTTFLATCLSSPAWGAPGKLATGMNPQQDPITYVPRDSDWNYWNNSPHMYSIPTGNIGIGTTNPTHQVHIVGSSSNPLLFVEKNGPGRGLKVVTSSACAIWVDNAGNHGLRVTHANGDGVHVTNANSDGVYIGNAYDDGVHVANAGDWAGWFNGDGYFAGNVGIGTEVPIVKLQVDGDIRANSGDYIGEFLRTYGALIPNGEIYRQGTDPVTITDDLAVDTNTLYVHDTDNRVGIGTTSPAYSLDVEGYVQAHGYYTGDIIFQNDGKQLWRMFEDEYGLYLESLTTGKVYRFVLQELNNNSNNNLGQTIMDQQQQIDDLKNEIKELKALLIDL